MFFQGCCSNGRPCAIFLCDRSLLREKCLHCASRPQFATSATCGRVCVSSILQVPVCHMCAKIHCWYNAREEEISTHENNGLADYTRIGSDKGKTPEHNQAKHTKHPHSLEWHNSAITIIFPSTLRNTLVVMVHTYITDATPVSKLALPTPPSKFVQLACARISTHCTLP